MNQELESLIARTVPGLPGWCTVEKALKMAQLILDVRPERCVEIGVFGGRSLVPQAMALRWLEEHEGGNGRIVGVDPWHAGWCLEGKNDEANDTWWKTTDLEAVHQATMSAIWSHHLHGRCIVMRTGSGEASTLFGYETVEIVHIDGNHSELASCRDVDLWLPRLRPGGYAWMDDTDWATTQKAVAKLTEQCVLVDEVANCRLFRKR